MENKTPRSITELYLGDYFQNDALGTFNYQPPDENNRSVEIALCESLVAEDPTCIEALQVLGHSYTDIGEYEKGLEMDIRLSRLLSDDALVHYNLACSYSLLIQLDEAFAALNKAVDLGYDTLEDLLDDVDLKNVLEDPRFETFLDRFKTRSEME